MILAGVAMLVISKKDHNKKALIGVHICLILISFTLVVANACQIGLIHQYATAYSAEVSFEHLENVPNYFAFQTSKWYGEEPRQTSVVAVELLGNFIVFIFSIIAVLVVPNMK